VAAREENVGELEPTADSGTGDDAVGRAALANSPSSAGCRKGRAWEAMWACGGRTSSMGESERSTKCSSSMACLSASDASAPSSSAFVWALPLSQRTTGVCLRLLAIDEEDAESLIDEVADLAIDVSLSSGEAGRLAGASDDERGASNDERGVDKSDSSLDLTGERVPNGLAMPSTVATDTKIHFSLVLQNHKFAHVPTATIPALRTPS